MEEFMGSFIVPVTLVYVLSVPHRESVVLNIN